ncbi:MAG: hypothetical protein JNM22_04680 [Saprospiraceae bacterium]|nr:hypothetical protein [Saprospiraceae bacterium]
MTLCVSWIRQVKNRQELVFATDTVLTGGERWDKGVKLFEMPRKDALLCFTGSTIRAYPLVLNLISSISYDQHLNSPMASLDDVVVHLTELFSKLIRTITEVDGMVHEARAEARFLFGGWDWEMEAFRVWAINYEATSESFLATELTGNEKQTSFYTFVGEANGVDIEQVAKKKFNQLLLDEDKVHQKLDMEPLKILKQIALDEEVREVGGSLQIAKVYKSNRTEFFGIFWQSSKGVPFFQGREYSNVTKPQVRYLNPDTFEIMELDLPDKLSEISKEIYGLHVEFISECYPDGFLKNEISERDKATLKTVFKEVAYAQFISKEEKTPNETLIFEELNPDEL